MASDEVGLLPLQQDWPPA